MHFTPLRRFVLFWSILLFSLSGCGESGVTTQEHLANARDYHNQQEYEAAKIELKNVLQQEPDNAEARWLLGRIYLEAGHGPAAEKEMRLALKYGVAGDAIKVPLTRALLIQRKFEEIVNTPVDLQGLSPDDQAEMLALFGHAHLALGHRKEAENAYDAAFAVRPDQPELGIGKARLAVTNNDFPTARQWLDKTLAATPDFASAWSAMGDLELLEGNAEAAEAAYTKAIANRRNNANDLLNRSLVRIHLKDFEGAGSDMEMLRKQVPKHPGIEYIKGLLAFHEKDYTKAKTAFLQVLASSPNYMPAIYYSAITAYKLNELEWADQYASQYLNALPGSDSAALLLAETRRRKGDSDSAEAIVLSVLKRDPNDVAALRLMADIALARGKPKDSNKLLKKLVSLEPESARAYMKMGLGSMMEDKHQQSTEDLQRAIELDPGLHKAEFMLALNHIKAGKYDQALATARDLQEKLPNSPTPLTLMAAIYVMQGNEPAARKALNNALELAPGDPQASNNLARLELVKGEFDKARALYEAVLERHPAHTASTIELARLDVAQGLLEEAKGRLEFIVRQDPEALRARVLLGSYYLRTGQPARVLALIREMPEAQANHPSALGLKGEAQLSLDRPDNAAATFRQLVKLVPRSVRAHFLLAKAYAVLNQASSVETELQKALAINPSFLPAKVALARLYIEQQNTGDASKLLEELKQSHARHPDVMSLEGWLAMRDNRPQDAVVAYATLLSAVPRSDTVLYLAAAQWQANDREASFKTLTSWLERHPEDVLVRYQLANSLLQLGETDKAVAELSIVVEQSPDHVVALNNLAWELRERNPDRAMKYAKQAFALAPEWAPLKDTLASLLLEKGEYERALRLLRSATSKMPADLDIRYHLAQALVQTGNQQEARQILEQLLAEDRPFASKDNASSLLKSLGGG